MDKRTFLRSMVATMMLIGGVMIATPFVESLSINPRQENAAWHACDVSALSPGEMKKCGWSVVYRRTEEDRASVTKFASLLADPNSIESQQPKGANNQWRSTNPEFFIFKPYAPVRGCLVESVTTGQMFRWKLPENDALKELPYFMEPCEGRTWDTSGRLYHRKGYPPEKNLIVPEVRWVSKTKVLVHAG